MGESSPLLVTASGTRQIIMTPSQLSQQGQVLISAGGQSLPVIVQNQRIVQGSSGQMLVASQPQQYIMSGESVTVISNGRNYHYYKIFYK